MFSWYCKSGYIMVRLWLVIILLFSFFQRLRYKGLDAMKRLMRIEPTDLPPSIYGVRNAVVRTVSLFNDIRTDIMEFYQVSLSLKNESEKCNINFMVYSN